MAETSSKDTDSGLSHLGFVRDYSEYAISRSYDLANQVYHAGRSVTPQFLEPQVQRVESLASEASSNYGAPVFNAVQDRTNQLLGLADRQVDGVFKRSQDFYNNNATYLSNAVKSQSDYHSKNLQHFKDARDAYLQQAKEAVNFLKTEGVSGAARKAADSLLATVEQAKAVPSYLGEQANALLDRVNSAWERLQSTPAVQKTLDRFGPSVDLAKKKYIEAHDALVTAPVYKKALETGEGVLNKVQTTYVYKTAANRLYPVISPYADPVVDKVSHNPYVNNVLEHLKPQSTVSASA